MPELQRFTLLRRINLGNYEHYEIEITIQDADENKAMERAVDLYERIVKTLDLRDAASINRIGKTDWSQVWMKAMNKQ